MAITLDYRDNQVLIKQVEDLTEYNKWVAAHCENGNVNWKTTRIDIINYLIQKNNYKRYLEIGIAAGECFRGVNIEHKDSVDPVKSADVKFVMTSDEYFRSLDKSAKYDIIFIDGLHHSGQVYEDIQNSLEHLEENGIIICHDMNPPFEVSQRREVVVGFWNGDCWKAFAKLRSRRADLEMCVVDTDWGVGIIKKGRQEIIQIPEKLSYTFLDENRQKLLNLITVEDFYKKF
jgi:hypothetical protein